MHIAYFRWIIVVLIVFVYSSGVSGLRRGLSSQIELMDGGNAVLRYFSPDEPLSAVLHEAWVMQLAAEMGVGPKIVQLDLDERYAVIEYIHDEPDWERAGTQLRKIHDGGRQPYRSLRRRYAAAVEKGVPLPSAMHEAMNRLDLIERLLGPAATLIHGDLHKGNIVSGYLIDWSEAGFGEPFFDLAKLSFSLSQFDQFFSAYLQRIPTEEDEARLYLAQQVVWLTIAVNRLCREQERGEQVVELLDELVIAGAQGVLPAMNYDPQSLRIGGTTALIHFLEETQSPRFQRYSQAIASQKMYQEESVCVGY